MCDYSLQHVASRPARVGETLVTTGFANTHTRGFAASSDLKVAVCLLPGTEIAFEHDARRDQFLLFSRSIGERVARFRQVNLEMRYSHHDALEFASGRVVLLTELSPGQRARVLQLPSKATAETDAGKRVTVIEGTVLPPAERRSEAVTGGGGA
jgi:hypothetical protein